MAEKSLQDKTEKATPKKRSEARKEGQVAKSREAVSASVLIAGLCAISVFGAYMCRHIEMVMQRGFSYVAFPDVNLSKFLEISEEMIISYFLIVLPLMGTIVLIALASNIMQVGFLFSFKSLAPKFEKINPLKGMERFVSKQAFMEIIKSISKLALVGAIAFLTVRGEMDNIMTLGQMEVPSIGLYVLKVVFKIFFRVSIAMVFLAIIDFTFQKWQFEEKLKMTKQEVKEEFKRTEGDPMVKGRIRRVQQEVARKRMMQEVPTADVVVTNPLHLAVAIKYDRITMNAPRVVAKGAELVAKRIREIAKENDVPLVENKLLARDLYKNVDIGEEVPSDFYQAVAEVLAYVYRLKGKAA